MTKYPLLVVATCVSCMVGKASSVEAATKTSKPQSNLSSSASPEKASATGVAESQKAPKALTVTQEEIRHAVIERRPAEQRAGAGKKEPATEKRKADAAGKHEDDADEGGPAKKTGAERKPALVSTMTPEELHGFADYPPALQEVVRKALELTTRKLRYQFGSSDPKAGGMDCSGTMFCVLKDSGLKAVPRQSDEICRWVMRESVLYRTEHVTSLKNDAFSSLHPGDLLFWTGTYDTGGGREIPISHVMMYLGKRKKDGKAVVFGASDGRTYDGERRNGVSVFDFSLPHRGSKAAFYGYGRIPGIHEQPKEEVRKAIVRAVPAYASGDAGG